MNKKKQDYITEIFESSKKYDCHLHAVTSEVCLEDKGVEQEGAKENENVLKNQENKPFIPDFEFATGVSCVLDDDLSARVRQRARDWIGLNFDKFPGATPVSMSRDNIRLLHEDFLVSWKADGTRYLMVILGRDQVYCIGTACNVFHIGGLTFPKSADLGDHLTDVLLDGEMVLDIIDGEKVPKFMIFDIIQIGDERVGNYDFRWRHPLIQKKIIAPRQEAIDKELIDDKTEPFLLGVKEYFDIGKTMHLVYNGAFLSKVAHKTDGLIFQRASGKKPYYRHGRHRKWKDLSILKWKPKELISIDFKLKLRTLDQSQTQALLYVSGQDTPYGEMKFHEDLIPYNNKIVECSYDFEVMTWVFIRVREDKGWPNYLTIADAICNTIEFPVTETNMLQIIDRITEDKVNTVRPMPLAKMKEKQTLYCSFAASFLAQDDEAQI